MKEETHFKYWNMFWVPSNCVSVKFHGCSLHQTHPLQAVVVEKNKYRGYFNEKKKMPTLGIRDGPFLYMVFPLGKLGWVVGFENVDCAN